MALTSIDVGAAASDRTNSSSVSNLTKVSKTNPANATGYITVIQIYCRDDATAPASGIEVASFSASGDDLTTNEYVSLANASIGLNTYRAPVDFTPFAISAGEYIGIKGTGGYIATDTAGGAGYWNKTGDWIPCTSEAFTPIANHELALYATGYDEFRGFINIGDVWKLIDTWQINIGDVWKTVSNVQINIGDAWKDAWLT